jgi:hypothetical protein
MMVPSERIIEAVDIQEAHNQMSHLFTNAQGDKNVPRPRMHSIIEIGPGVVIPFGPSPAA